MPRRKGRRSFGSLRQLPSGRWQARYRDAAGKSHTASETFATRPQAARFLAQVETDLARGEWTDPRAGRVSFAEWAARWQATTTNLRPNTRALHGYLLRRFLLPAFADTALADLDLMVVRSWRGRLARPRRQGLPAAGPDHGHRRGGRPARAEPLLGEGRGYRAGTGDAGRHRRPNRRSAPGHRPPLPPPGPRASLRRAGVGRAGRPPGQAGGPTASADPGRGAGNRDRWALHLGAAAQD